MHGLLHPLGRLVAVLAFVAVTASAQTPRPARLYLGNGVLIGSSRLVALAGAYVGVAEGADGLPSNYASIAQRAPDRDDVYAIDGSLSFLLAAAPGSRDLDNDGVRDLAAGAQELVVSGLLQLGRGGLGMYVRSSSARFCLPSPCAAALQLDTQRLVAGAGGAVAMWRDQLILGLGFLVGSASFRLGDERRTYVGSTIEVDALVRPEGLPFRIGVSVKPPTYGRLQVAAGAEQLLGERALYAGTVTPFTLSVGGSLRLGRGANHYNRLSPDALAGEASPLPPLPDGHPPGRWVVTAQADLFLPVSGATGLGTFVRDLDASVAPVVGATPTVALRLGAEHETLLRRWRNRLGVYVEPSAFEGGPTRVHLTGGGEVRLFHLWKDWALSAAFDVARAYYNFGGSIGFWH